MDIIQDVRRYLNCQSDLYGNELLCSNADIMDSWSNHVIEGSLDKYKNKIQLCKKCELSRTRHHFVFGDGNHDANLMLIGEAPGKDEDIQGLPFVGKAGQLLDKILASIDFKREEIFIGNILKCRPPHNRNPLPEEIDLCMPYLEKQIQLIQPQIILVLGRIAANALLNTALPISKLRGMVHQYRDISLIVTFHPAALLRNPQWKRPVWEDVQKLRTLYDKIVGDKPEWTRPKK